MADAEWDSRENASGPGMAPPPGEKDFLVPVSAGERARDELDREEGGGAGLMPRFVEMLAAEPGVPREQKTYYVYWARSFLRFCETGGHHPGGLEGRRKFVGSLAQYGRPVFILKQAEKAVRILQRLIARPDASEAVSEEPRKDRTAKGLEGSENRESIDALERRAVDGWEAARKKVADEIRIRHYSRKTLKTYVHWTRVFARYLEIRMPEEVDSGDARAFLEHLALERKIAASTQNQAFNALLFLYNHVLNKDLSDLETTPRAKKGMNVPEVLTREEVQQVFRYLGPPYDVFFQLLYGCGLRLGEGLGLRIKDLDFGLGCLTVHRGKGGKSRKVPLPLRLRAALEDHLKRVRKVFESDERDAIGGVFLPEALEGKLPGAARDWSWFWVFPAKERTAVPERRELRRSHLHESQAQKAIKEAVTKAGLVKRASAHTFRHSYATHLLQMGTDIRTVQILLGHEDVKTTQIYVHALSGLSKAPMSPLDWVEEPGEDYFFSKRFLSSAVVPWPVPILTSSWEKLSMKEVSR
jgi:integron integrase